MFGLEEERNEPLPPQLRPAAKKKTSKSAEPEPDDGLPF
jgi:hypothetical protein